MLGLRWQVRLHQRALVNHREDDVLTEPPLTRDNLAALPEPPSDTAVQRTPLGALWEARPRSHHTRLRR